MEKNTRFETRNRYGRDEKSKHRTVETALKARDLREGLGWEVYDEEGNKWDYDFDGNPRIIEAKGDKNV